MQPKVTRAPIGGLMGLLAGAVAVLHLVIDRRLEASLATTAILLAGWAIGTLIGAVAYGATLKQAFAKDHSGPMLLAFAAFAIVDLTGGSSTAHGIAAMGGVIIGFMIFGRKGK